MASASVSASTTSPNPNQAITVRYSWSSTAPFLHRVRLYNNGSLFSTIGGQGMVISSGSRTITVSGQPAGTTRRYRIRAEGFLSFNQDITTVVTWQGIDPPTVSVSVSNSSPFDDQAVTVSWSISGDSITSVSDPFGGSSTSGSRSVGPFAAGTSNTYRASATNAGGSRSDSETVRWVLRPPAVSVSVSPTNPYSDQSATVSWSISGDSITSVSDPFGGSTQSGSRSVGPFSSGTSRTYTASATNAGGTRSDNARATWRSRPPAPRVSVSASRTSPFDDQTSTISWSISGTGLRNVRDPFSGSSRSGSRSVGPFSGGTSRVYRASATNDGGSDSDSVTVRWRSRVARPVVSISADHTERNVGEDAIITWSVTGTTTSITDPNGDNNRTGSITVNRPSIESATGSAIYTITAANAGGSSTASVTVTWTGPNGLFTVSAERVAIGEGIDVEWTYGNLIGALRVNAVISNENEPEGGRSMLIFPATIPNNRRTNIIYDIPTTMCWELRDTNDLDTILATTCIEWFEPSTDGPWASLTKVRELSTDGPWAPLRGITSEDGPWSNLTNALPLNLPPICLPLPDRVFDASENVEIESISIAEYLTDDQDERDDTVTIVDAFAVPAANDFAFLSFDTDIIIVYSSAGRWLASITPEDSAGLQGDPCTFTIAVGPRPTCVIEADFTERDLGERAVLTWATTNLVDGDEVAVVAQQTLPVLLDEVVISDSVNGTANALRTEAGTVVYTVRVNWAGGVECEHSVTVVWGGVSEDGPWASLVKATPPVSTDGPWSALVKATPPASTDGPWSGLAHATPPPSTDGPWAGLVRATPPVSTDGPWSELVYATPDPSTDGPWAGNLFLVKVRERSTDGPWAALTKATPPASTDGPWAALVKAVPLPSTDGPWFELISAILPQLPPVCAPFPVFQFPSLPEFDDRIAPLVNLEDYVTDPNGDTFRVRFNSLMMSPIGGPNQVIGVYFENDEPTSLNLQLYWQGNAPSIEYTVTFFVQDSTGRVSDECSLTVVVGSQDGPWGPLTPADAIGESEWSAIVGPVHAPSWGPEQLPTLGAWSMMALAHLPAHGEPDLAYHAPWSIIPQAHRPSYGDPELALVSMWGAMAESVLRPGSGDPTLALCVKWSEAITPRPRPKAGEAFFLAVPSLYSVIMGPEHRPQWGGPRLAIRNSDWADLSNRAHRNAWGTESLAYLMPWSECP